MLEPRRIRARASDSRAGTSQFGCSAYTLCLRSPYRWVTRFNRGVNRSQPLVHRRAAILFRQ